MIGVKVATIAEPRSRVSRIEGYVTITFLVLGFLILADLVWQQFSTISLYEDFSTDCLKLTGLYGGLYLVGLGVEQRLKNDGSKIGASISSLAKNLQTLMAAWLLMTATLMSITIFSYLGSATSWPLIDPHLIEFERMIGFSWDRFIAAANANAFVAKVIFLSYHSMTPQIALTVIFLAMTARRERLAEFVALFSSTAMVCCVIMALLPSIGPHGFLNPPQEIRFNFSANAGIHHFDIVMALRTLKPFLIDSAEGLVTFPSFHTVTAILLVHAARGIRFVFWPVFVLNILLIIGTLPEGGHYLADVIAGAVIALAAIAALDKLVDRLASADVS